MVEADLKVRTLKGIYIYKKDFKTQFSRCNPWSSQIGPFPDYSRNLNEYLNRKQQLSMTYDRRPLHEKMVTNKIKRNMVNLTPKH